MVKPVSPCDRRRACRVGLSCRLIVNYPGDKCVLFCQAGILFALNSCVRSNLLFSGLWYKSLPLLKLEPLALKAPHFRASMATRAACLASRVGSLASVAAVRRSDRSYLRVFFKLLS
jgi:hypothetical protein